MQSEEMYSASLFNAPRWWEAKQKYIFDNKPRRFDIKDWDEFIRFIEFLAQQQYHDKFHAGMISPAVYRDDQTRANANVLYWAKWCAVDIDDFGPTDDLKSDLDKWVGKYDYICCNSARSTNDHPKFRLIFNLSRNVEAKDIKHFWFALNSELQNAADKQTKDLSRLFFLPGNYDSADNFIWVNRGKPINVDHLIEKWPYQDKSQMSLESSLPEAMRQKLLQFKKDKLTNNDIKWTDYTNCPFVNQKILNDYKQIAFIDGTGRYRMIYKIMCAIAGNAVKQGYPLTEQQLVSLVKQIDTDTANRYQNRALDVEARNALQYAYNNAFPL